MADIFISYTKEDRSRVEPLVKTLTDQGWSVWWDRTIPAGKTWREVIGEALKTARVVIVTWSKTSVQSRWVQEEADWGLDHKILIPILIDDVKPPLGFGTVQAAELISWNPSQPSPEFEKLVGDISAILGPHPKMEVKNEERKKTKKVTVEKKRGKPESVKFKHSKPEPSTLRKTIKVIKWVVQLTILLGIVGGIWYFVENTTSALIEDLRDKDPKVRANAAMKLMNDYPISLMDYVPALTLALKDQDPLVRRYIVVALGRGAALTFDGANAGVPALIEALEDQEPAVRSAAASALGYIAGVLPENIRSKTKAAVPALTKAIYDSDAVVRSEAKKALKKIGSR